MNSENKVECENNTNAKNISDLWNILKPFYHINGNKDQIHLFMDHRNLTYLITPEWSEKMSYFARLRRWSLTFQHLNLIVNPTYSINLTREIYRKNMNFLNEAKWECIEKCLWLLQIHSNASFRDKKSVLINSIIKICEN